MKRPPSEYPPQTWVGIGAAAAMAIGAFGPWIKAPLGISVSGTDGTNDGWVVVVCAVFAALGALVYGREGKRSMGLVMLIPGAAAAVTCWYDRGEINDRISDAGFGSIGWGLNLAMVAGGVAALLGFLTLLNVRWDTHRQLGPPPTSG